MNEMCIRTQPEQLSCNMRLTQSNHTFIELICEREDVQTMNAALSKIIEVARPFFTRRTSKAEKKLNKIKRADEIAVHQAQSKSEVDYIEEYEEVT